jgi:tetratricopeptide (TPR) repeat protein
MACTKVKPQAVETALAKGQGKGHRSGRIGGGLPPRESSLRATLGRAYLKNGRFQSAATALSDAVSLGDNSGRTLLALALSQIGSGQNDAALRTLEMGNNVIPWPTLALRWLWPAKRTRVRSCWPTPCAPGTRATSCAPIWAMLHALAADGLSGAHDRAFDLPADKVDERMTEWAARPKPAVARSQPFWA